MFHVHKYVCKDTNLCPMLGYGSYLYYRTCSYRPSTGGIYITGPVLIKSDDNPTFLAVYRVEERVPWESAASKCEDILKEGASFLDASDQEMFNVSAFHHIKRRHNNEISQFAFCRLNS